MYNYRFKITASHPQKKIDAEIFGGLFYAAVENANNGISFHRQGKSMKIESIMDGKVIITLSSKAPLPHSAKPLRTITIFILNYLRANNPERINEYLYNNQLFLFKFLDESSDITNIEPEDISDPQLLTAIINLLFTPATTQKEKERRESAITQIKELIKPYVK